MADSQKIGQPVPAGAVPIAGQKADGTLAYLTLDSSGNLNTVGGGGGGGGAVTVADGADVTQGAIADAAVTGDNSGTLSAKLRGINKVLASVWDSVNNWLKVSIQNATLAVTQSGTWTVQPGNTQNTTPWKVDGSDVTQPISAASLPLPTGASTAAKQPALGTAGTASADVITIQGIASMTAVAVSQSGIWTDQVVGNVAHDDADSGNPVKIGGKAATALPTAVAANDRANLITDVYGRPFVRVGREGPAASYSHHQHNPAANTRATITKSTAGSGVRNVCTGLTVAIAATATAPTAVQLTVALIDGASGGTTYLWGPTVISLPATAGATTAYVMSNCWKPGTADTAMTLEFSAAGGANTVESVEFDATTVVG